MKMKRKETKQGSTWNDRNMISWIQHRFTVFGFLVIILLCLNILVTANMNHSLNESPLLDVNISHEKSSAQSTPHDDENFDFRDDQVNEISASQIQKLHSHDHYQNSKWSKRQRQDRLLQHHHDTSYPVTSSSWKIPPNYKTMHEYQSSAIKSSDSILRGTASLTPHAPISIGNDADFLAQATSEGWPGDGSSTNPILISNLNITMTGPGTGITISNTNLHFRLLNILIQNGTTGISLQNVTNGIIENITLINLSSTGIHAWRSRLLQINSNYIANIGWMGITFYGTNESLVQDNTFFNVNNYGIHAPSDTDKSSNDAFNGNTFWYMGDRAFDIGGFNHTIQDNVITGGIYGITMPRLHDSVIQGNIITNIIGGAAMSFYWGGSNVSILDNTIQGVINASGISGDLLDGLKVSNNTLTEITWGSINLGNAVTNALIQDNIIDKAGSGISVSGSDSSNITVQHNTIQDLTGDGIEVYMAHHVRIFNNTIRNVSAGISLFENAHHLKVMNNTISLTTWNGINSSWGGTWNVTIANNTISTNREQWSSGIYLGDISYHVVIVDNFIEGYKGGGIYMDIVRNITIKRNRISHITEGTGISVTHDTEEILIEQNVIHNITWDGIMMACCGQVRSLLVRYNHVRDVAGSGINVGNNVTSNITIQGNIIDTASVGMGFHGASVTNITIRDNLVKNTSDNGIQVDGGTHHLQFINNTIQDVLFGFHVMNQARDFVIMENRISRTQWDGILFDIGGGWNVTISNNVISTTMQGGAGIALNDGNNHDVFIINNTINNYGWTGIGIGNGARSISIQGNHILNIQSNGINIFDNASSVNIFNNSIEKTEKGIEIHGTSANIRVWNNTIFNIKFDAILMFEEPHSLELSNNTLFNIKNGFTMYNKVHDVVIRGNRVLNASKALVNGYGIGIKVWAHLQFGLNFLIENNLLKDCDIYGIELEGGHAITIRNNQIVSSGGSGIHARFSSTVTNSTTIEHNTIKGNKENGIFVESGGNMIIKNNVIIGNGNTGIKLGGINNTVINNDFIANNRQATHEGGTRSNNKFDYNYWDDWVVPDRNDNGIVDDPYEIFGTSTPLFDIHPQVYPNDPSLHIFSRFRFFSLEPGWQTLQGVVVINWTTIIDSQRHPVTFDVYFSLDNGETWALIAQDLTTTQVEWDTTKVPDLEYFTGRVKVVASDGINLTKDYISKPFKISNSETTTSSPPSSTWVTTTASQSPSDATGTTNQSSSTTSIPTVIVVNTPSFQLVTTILTILSMNCIIILKRKKIINLIRDP